MGSLSLIERAEEAPDKIAVIATEGRFTFGDLTAASRRVGSNLLGAQSDLGEARVAFMVPPGFRYVALQWGTWAAGGISMPLRLTYPRPELEHVIGDADASVIVVSAEYRSLLEPIARERGTPLVDADDIVFTPTTETELPDLDEGRRCLILYTSGTTGRAKGVVWTFANLYAQLRSLSKAWQWSADDRTLLVLPLHHVHGLVNVVTCALWNRASCEMLPRFDVDETWERLVDRELTVFMAVPTIYRRLIEAWESAPEADRRRRSATLEAMRLMVSGSAALPVPMLEQWRAISGHTLLERYGMTEIGMALSNPYEGRRTPGAVGVPLPSVELRLFDADGDVVAVGSSGEIEVKGPSVFLEYWGRPEETAKAFRDGWFRTGDVATLEAGVYRILGRQSVDIIKTGAEKVSALEIEAVLREHTAVQDCAAVGVEDPEWGERVAAAIVPAGDAVLDLAELRAFARGRLAPYKVPRQIIIVEELPRNALGKVVKPRVKELIAAEPG